MCLNCRVGNDSCWQASRQLSKCLVARLMWSCDSEAYICNLALCSASSHPPTHLAPILFSCKCVFVCLSFLTIFCCIGQQLRQNFFRKMSNTHEGNCGQTVQLSPQILVQILRHSEPPQNKRAAACQKQGFESSVYCQGMCQTSRWLHFAEDRSWPCLDLNTTGPLYTNCIILTISLSRSVSLSLSLSLSPKLWHAHGHKQVSGLITKYNDFYSLSPRLDHLSLKTNVATLTL